MKKILISILTIFFIVSMITTVNAATGSINAGASSESVIKGKTFTVTIAGTADNNITAMQAALSYDSNKLSIESKAVGTGFSDLSGTNKIEIAATSAESLSKSGTLYTITFKVLDNAEEGNTTISISNAILALVNENSEQENVNVTDQNVTITIKSDDTTVDGNQDEILEDEEDTTENTPSNTSNSNNKSTNTSKSNTVNKNTTTNKTELPQTGLESSGVFVIIALGAVAITSFISYRKYKNI